MSQIIGKRGKRSFRHGEAGFTLVEVVVVIGILALLCAMLFPTLARTRAGANQAQCQNNLQQIFGAIKSYAGDNHGQIPLGYIAGVKQLDYIVYNQNDHVGTTLGATWNPNDPNYAKNFVSGKGANWGIGHTATTLGLMVPTYIADGSVLYCPAGVASGKGVQYKNAENPWPFPLDHDPKNFQKEHTRIDYSQRPAANFGNQFFPIQPGQDQGMYVPAPFPKLADLGTKAVLADAVTTANELINRHVDGVNVIYADGATAYVPLKQFSTNLDALGKKRAATNNATFLDESKPNAPSGLWADLDAAHPTAP
jgi:prepilin-type N-terminal cleavage/methylation domain-containing protein